MAKKTETPPTPKQIKEWQQKANKWDALDQRIGAFYDTEKEGDAEEEGDLVTIGEIAARAFGYL